MEEVVIGERMGVWPDGRYARLEGVVRKLRERWGVVGAHFAPAMLVRAAVRLRERSVDARSGGGGVPRSFVSVSSNNCGLVAHIVRPSAVCPVST